MKKVNNTTTNNMKTNNKKKKEQKDVVKLGETIYLENGNEFQRINIDFKKLNLILAEKRKNEINEMNESLYDLGRTVDLMDRVSKSKIFPVSSIKIDRVRELNSKLAQATNYISEICKEIELSTLPLEDQNKYEDIRIWEESQNDSDHYASSSFISGKFSSFVNHI